MEPLSTSLCRSCRTLKPTSRRAFSTTGTRRNIPPESPAYIDVPSSFQPYQPWTAPQKGILPTPRELFPSTRPDKIPTEAYLDSLLPDALPHNTNPTSKTGKQKIAATAQRKAHLRTGLTSLWARKEIEIKAMQTRSRNKTLERTRLLAQAEREDSRLTNSSVPEEMRPGYNKTLAAMQAELDAAKRLHAQKTANVSKHDAAKKAERLDRLHTLYMNARAFITTEAQLDEAIKEQFDVHPATSIQEYKPSHADFRTDRGNGTSMWNFGPPDSVKDLIADGTMKGGEGQGVNGRGMSGVGRMHAGNLFRERGEEAVFNKEQGRFKKIAEKLSGGKI